MYMITVIEPSWGYIESPRSMTEIYAGVYRFLEVCGRTCYKSEDRITDESAARFLKNLMNGKPKPHASVIEHFGATVRIICSRACSHQIVRHRIGSYSQESQRYCNYGKKGLQLICPPSIGIPPGTYERDTFWSDKLNLRQKRWLTVRDEEYEEYLEELKEGIPPEDARFNLPNACKTEIVCTYNLRTWRHIFEERAINPRAQWEIRGIFSSILEDMRTRMPVLFGDLK